jgi:hypothetical protein
MIIPIVACNIGSKSVEVLKSSVATYNPDTPLLISYPKRSTFGQCYNEALALAFETYDEVFIANDDVVLTPTTISDLMSDVNKLKEHFKQNPQEGRLGYVATMADNIRLSQNVRYKFFGDNDEMYGGKWKSEGQIKCVPVIAPIFAWLSKEAFTVAQFPPINWYSDDIQCDDLTKAGFKHFVSTAYIHHVGSSTIGLDYDKLYKEALPWIQENRPDFLPELEKRKTFIL